MTFHKLVACVIFVALSDYISASKANFCGKCSPKSGVKCIDEDTFIFCDRSGLPTEKAASCPAGQKCVNNVHICAKVEQGECRSKCQECFNGRFTCISRTAFSLCFGRNQTSRVAAKCAIGKVCSTAKFDASSPNPILDFCFDEIDLEPYEIDCYDHEAPTFVPTRPPKVEAKPPVHPAPPRPGRPGKPSRPGRPHSAITEPPEVPEEEPYHFCNGKKAGKYQITTDRKCQKYYVCYQNGTQMVGDIYVCVEHSVYDPKVQKCVVPTANFYKNNKCGENAGRPNHRIAMEHLSPIPNAIPITYGTPFNQMGYMTWADYMRAGHPAFQPYPILTHPISPANSANPWSIPNYYYPFNFAMPTNMERPFLARPYSNPSEYYKAADQAPSHHQPSPVEMGSTGYQSQPVEVWDHVIESTLPESVGSPQKIMLDAGAST